jgi:hypothetical protein
MHRQNLIDHSFFNGKLHKQINGNLKTERSDVFNINNKKSITK